VEDASKVGVEFIPFLRVEPDVLADFGGGERGAVARGRASR